MELKQMIYINYEKSLWYHAALVDHVQPTTDLCRDRYFVIFIFSIENSSKCAVSISFLDKLFKPINSSNELFPLMKSLSLFVIKTSKFSKISQILLDLEF